jgi:hypothetical protein
VPASTQSAGRRLVQGPPAAGMRRRNRPRKARDPASSSVGQATGIEKTWLVPKPEAWLVPHQLVEKQSRYGQKTGEPEQVGDGGQEEIGAEGRVEAGSPE